MYELFKIHPFRKGNGRATREFLRELTIKYVPGYTIDWSKVDSNNYNQAFAFPYIGKSLLQIELAKAVVPIESLNIVSINSAHLL